MNISLGAFSVTTEAILQKNSAEYLTWKFLAHMVEVISNRKWHQNGNCWEILVTGSTITFPLFWGITFPLVTVIVI